MSSFSLASKPNTPFLEKFATGLKKEFLHRGYSFSEEQELEELRLVFHFIQADKPRAFRRKSQGTFVISVLETNSHAPEENNTAILKAAYPYLVRTLANHLLYISHLKQGSVIYFITPEQGCYSIPYRPEEEEQFFQHIFQRLEPLASSQLVINNEFLPDLPRELWNGDELTEKLSQSGKKLDDMNLLPAPFPLKELVSERDLRHIHKLYGIGGLSYGNLSSRRNKDSFWMSASGVNKAKMKVIGQDMLLIKGYNNKKNAMQISIPPEIRAKRASVDAIEHWMIYTEHPDVGAIVHIHAWMEGVTATEINYPCGTLQLAETVAQLIREAEKPAQACIGLKNHGLTLTGRDLDDIFERIEGKIIPQVPMS